MSTSRLRPLLAGSATVLALAIPASAAADTHPPTVPDGLRVTATTVTTASLAWSASIDGSGSVRYRVLELASSVMVTL